MIAEWPDLFRDLMTMSMLGTSLQTRFVCTRLWRRRSRR